ncbi:MAG: pyrrolo-quinoline quinone [Candidatus Eremiobacteraeota bacterium]|nr:pyrrolo-quinoline quinone [Candidatus Eremiobacteraeota bacterium]
MIEHTLRKVLRLAPCLAAGALVPVGCSSPLPAPQSPPPAHSAFAGVLTWHNDEARTGQNRAETVLTPALVNRKHFGKLFSYRVDGQLYAQPLYVPGTRVSGHGTRDLVIVASEHDSVYAFDATAPRAVWHRSFIDPARGITTVPCTNPSQSECDPTIMAPEHGITGTPVIDASTGRLYVDVKTDERGVFIERLHALDVANGAEVPGSPVTVRATAPGFPRTDFEPHTAFERSGLALDRGIVYIAYASNDDAQGWLIGFDASSLGVVRAFCVTPKGKLGGIWDGGAAPAIDDGGDLYVSTGNGSFDAAGGGANYGMSVIRLKATGQLRAVDYFTPFNERPMSRRDLDLGSGGVMLLPDHPGPHRHEAVAGGKEGKLFMLDRDAMGEFHPSGNHVVQQLDANLRNGYYSSAAYFDGAVYMAGVSSHLDRYALHGARLSDAPTSRSIEYYDYPGATPATSSNGERNGIVWVVSVAGRVRGGPPAVLRAYDARDVTHELYGSDQEGARDRAGPSVKFAVPTIANGRVYVGTQTELDVYGVLPPS